MSEKQLTLPQRQVLTLIAQGSTVAAAAQVAGVHRNTVANWRRGASPGFREAWQAAQFEQAEHWRDQIQALGSLAVTSLQHILADDRTPASVRLKAALAVLTVLTTPATVQSDRLHNTAQPALREECQVQENIAALSENTESAKTAAATACAPLNHAQPCTTDVETRVVSEVAGGASKKISELTPITGPLPPLIHVWPSLNGG